MQGTPTPLDLKGGMNAVDVAVTASDGITIKHYAIAVNALVNDYIKASNTSSGMNFGGPALSSDGNTLAVVAFTEPSGATGIDGNQSDTSAGGSGAVYVFTRTGTTWKQEAYIKPSNTRASQFFGGHPPFGHSVALSGDGNTLAVGSHNESSNATGIDGNQADTSATGTGAVYLFVRSAGTWTQQHYVKPSNVQQGNFGSAVALSTDGSTLAVGAPFEASKSMGIDQDGTDTSAPASGAAYVFVRAGAMISQQAYIKASNTAPNAQFGTAVALSSNGNALAVGATGEASNATGVGGTQTDTSAMGAGAVYTFTRLGTSWTQDAYVKASNTRAGAIFGTCVALSGDGNTLAVGSPAETSGSTGINANGSDASLTNAGAGYVFARQGNGTWAQQAYVKASTSGPDYFGNGVSLSADGNTLVFSAPSEASSATGINGNQGNTSEPGTGAAYVFTRNVTTWTQFAYVKPSNSHAGGTSIQFGSSVALSPDGHTLACGAPGDSSNAKGINGDQTDTSLNRAGAAYVF
jgi:hypothetical protein